MHGWSDIFAISRTTHVIILYDFSMDFVILFLVDIVHLIKGCRIQTESRKTQSTDWLIGCE